MKTLLLMVMIAIWDTLVFMVKKLRKRVKRYEVYTHHGCLVWVRKDLKGKHRDHCLCFDCEEFHPGSIDNCPIASAVYENCVNLNIVTPVFECPNFWSKVTSKGKL